MKERESRKEIRNYSVMLLGTRPASWCIKIWKDTVNMFPRGTPYFSPCKMIHCEKQLVLQITVTSTRSLAVTIPCRRCFTPVNTDKIQCAVSQYSGLQASHHRFHFNRINKLFHWSILCSLMWLPMRVIPHTSHTCFFSSKLKKEWKRKT